MIVPDPEWTWQALSDDQRMIWARYSAALVQSPPGRPPDGWLAVPSYSQVESVMQQRHWPYDARVTVNVHYTLHNPADRCWCPSGHLPPHCGEPEPSLARHYMPSRWLLNLTWLAVVAVLVLLAVRLS